MLDRDANAEGAARAVVHAVAQGENVVVHVGSSTVEFNRRARPDTAVETTASAPDLEAVNKAMNERVALDRIRRIFTDHRIVDANKLGSMTDAELSERLRRAFDY